MSLHLTSRQSNILEFIRARVAQTGQAPTLEEIGQAMGLPN
ncbi:MAG: repressor LexA, partial [Rhodanobacter sp.]